MKDVLFTHYNYLQAQLLTVEKLNVDLLKTEHDITPTNKAEIEKILADKEIEISFI